MTKQVSQLVKLEKNNSKYYAIRLDFPKIYDVNVYLNGCRLVVHEGNDRIKITPDCRLINGYLFLSPHIAGVADFGDVIKINGTIKNKTIIW